MGDAGLWLDCRDLYLRRKCVRSHHLVVDPFLSDATALVSPILMLFAIIVPYCLWLFARAIFEAAWPPWWVLAGFALIALCVWTVFITEAAWPPWWVLAGFALIALCVWTVFITEASLGGDWAGIASIAMHVASLAAVAHALWIAVKGRSDDLIERRRRFRLFFVAIIATQIGIVLAVELAMGGTEPSWLVFLNVLVIAVLTVGFAVPLLELNPEFFAPLPVRGKQSIDKDSEALGPAEHILKQALLSAISEGIHQQSGLTIRSLSEQLNHPEHHLRKLINGHLGFRNFSEFLNSYRVADAKIVLADPQAVRTPVLTIALELGYGSIGPFNRAFKAATNMTPTEFRQSALSSKRTDSE